MKLKCLNIFCLIFFNFIYLKLCSQVDSIINHNKIDNTIVNSNYFRYNDNAFSLPKESMCLTGYQIFLLSASYGVTPSLSIEGGFYQRPYSDDIYSLGLKAKKTFNISSKFNVALKPAIVNLRSFKTQHLSLDGIMTFGSNNNLIYKICQ